MQASATLQIHTARRARPILDALAALLPPLALFVSLALVLGALFDVPNGASALLLGGAALCVCALVPPRRAWIAGAAFAVSAALCFALLPSARDGALALANRLFAASEASNAYAYEHFAVPDAAEAYAALPAAVLLGALCVFAARRRGAPLALLLAVAFAEAYFGVTPGLWRNALFFAVLAALTAFRGREAESAAALLSAAAVTALAVFLLAPRPVATVEAYSEHLRDELGRAAMTLTRRLPQPEEEENRARRESRQHEESARADDARSDAALGFARQTEREREISLPRRVDWARIVLLSLAALALLVVPFLPFLLLNRAKRRAEARRTAFADPDNAAAVRAMFSHTMDWLRAFGLRTENRPWAQCAEAVEALTSPEYAARYAAASSIWEEAAYSDHAMTGAQRETVRELLDATAATVCERADWRTKLRVKYVDALCGS